MSSILHLTNVALLQFDVQYNNLPNKEPTIAVSGCTLNAPPEVFLYFRKSFATFLIPPICIATSFSASLKLLALHLIQMINWQHDGWPTSHQRLVASLTYKTVNYRAAAFGENLNHDWFKSGNLYQHLTPSLAVDVGSTCLCSAPAQYSLGSHGVLAAALCPFS